MTARVLSYREWSDGMGTCRLQLASGEKLYIKVLRAPSMFAGVWQLGSFNPVTIVIDWLMSKFTHIRTAGLVQLWGLNAKDIGGPAKWLVAIDAMFGLQGGAVTPLRAIADALSRCQSVSEVELFMAARQGAILHGPSANTR